MINAHTLTHKYPGRQRPWFGVGIAGTPPMP
jgi:hypothetical protein